MKKKDISEVMRYLGRKGGKAGSREDKSKAGKKSMALLTPEERSALARKGGKAGAKARWAKRKHK